MPTLEFSKGLSTIESPACEEEQDNRFSTEICQRSLSSVACIKVEIERWFSFERMRWFTIFRHGKTGFEDGLVAFCNPPRNSCIENR